MSLLIAESNIRSYRNSVDNAIAHAQTLLCHLGVLKDGVCEDNDEAKFVAAEAQNEANAVNEYLDLVKKAL